MKWLCRDRLLLLGLVSLLLIAVGVMLYRHGMETRSGPAVSSPRADGEGEREVALYFGAVDGVALVAERRVIKGCADHTSCLSATLGALIDGPAGDLVPILPPRTRLLGASEREGVATVDFNNALILQHPGGSVSELLTAYGLINSLAENFPHIRQLRVLVEGEPVETLKGHVDLRQPLTPDFRYARFPDGRLPDPAVLEAIEDYLPRSEKETNP